METERVLMEQIPQRLAEHMNIESNKSIRLQKDQLFYGRGKLLLSGEYFILKGATGLALPTRVGQSLSVSYSPSFSPKLYWKSFDVHGNLWFEAVFEFWQFGILSTSLTKEALLLQKILTQARAQNSHFLRDGVDVNVETYIEFPLQWGLGSSSTLIYNIAQWAYVSPFELLFQGPGGSGYDIACAQADGPIIYTKKNNSPSWRPTYFDPLFKENIFFLFLGKKVSSLDAIAYFQSLGGHSRQLIKDISELTQEMIQSKTIEEFSEVVAAHEMILSAAIKQVPVKEEFFADFWGEMKSLGAWGGDFAMVCSRRPYEETLDYFVKKGFGVLIRFEDLVLNGQREIGQ